MHVSENCSATAGISIVSLFYAWINKCPMAEGLAYTSKA